MRSVGLTLLAVLLSAAAGAAGQAPSAADLAARVQAHYAQVRDFTASFTLTQSSALLPRPTTERGSVKVKKPGRMRWLYTADKKEFVADGSMLYSFFPRDKYVNVNPLPKGEDASTALLFLTGRGDLARDFTSTLDGDQPAGEWRLNLKPKAKQTDFTSLALEVERTTLALRGITVVDDQGGTSRFRFEGLKENVGLADRDFEFKIPPGVEVRK
jgi:outer membrane lipoprotein carrier protein